MSAVIEHLAAHRISCVAIRHNSGLIISAPKPARHHHLIWDLAELGVACPIGHINGYEQGFLDSWGTFLDRDEAARLVNKYNGPLFSEDLW